MGITVEEMIREMPELAAIDKPRSKIKKDDLIELLYYQRKADEVLRRYKGTWWTLLLKRQYERMTGKLPAEE